MLWEVEIYVSVFDMGTIFGECLVNKEAVN